MALTYIGSSAVMATNGGAPTAITPHASSAAGDLLIFHHWSKPPNLTATVTVPTGFTDFLNADGGITIGGDLIAAGRRVMQAGDTTFTATITGHTSGNTGDTVLEWIETWRGQDTTTPIGSISTPTPTASPGTNIGPINAPASPSLANGDAVIVFGGRGDNVTGQTVLTGHSLTWATRVLADSSLGSDAGAVTQSGLNASGSAQTITAKTITTTGTGSECLGAMYYIKAATGGATTNAPAEVASATATAQDAQARVAPSAEAASSSAAAQDAQASIRPSAEAAPATAAAQDAQARVAASAEAASSSWGALDATVDTGAAATNAPAEVAPATALAQDAQAAIAPNADPALATAQAQDAQTSVRVNAEAAVASATALDAQALTGTIVQAQAATTTWTATDARTAVAPGAEAALASVAAQDVQAQVKAVAAAAVAAMTAPDAGPWVRASAEAAVASLVASDAQVSLRVQVEAAVAAIVAWDAEVAPQFVQHWCVTGREPRMAWDGREPCLTVTGREPRMVFTGREPRMALTGRGRRMAWSGRERQEECP